MPDEEQGDENNGEYSAGEDGGVQDEPQNSGDEQESDNGDGD
jgi:hypothetical protein